MPSCSVTAISAASSSAGFWKRSSGRLASIVSSTSTTDSGTSGRNCATFGRLARLMLQQLLQTVPSGNGGWPMSMKNNVQPSE